MTGSPGERVGSSRGRWGRAAHLDSQWTSGPRTQVFLLKGPVILSLLRSEIKHWGSLGSTFTFDFRVGSRALERLVLPKRWSLLSSLLPEMGSLSSPSCLLHPVGPSAACVHTCEILSHWRAERVLPPWSGPPVSTPGVDYARPVRIALAALPDPDPDRDLRRGRRLKGPGRQVLWVTHALGTCFRSSAA